MASRPKLTSQGEQAISTSKAQRTYSNSQEQHDKPLSQTAKRTSFPAFAGLFDFSLTCDIRRVLVTEVGCKERYGN